MRTAPGAGEEDAGMTVGDRGDVVAQRGRINSAARDVSEMSRGSGIQAGSNDIVIEKFQQRLESNGIFGNGRVVESDALVFG